MREYERRRRWTPWHVLAVVLILGVLAVALLLVYGLTDRRPGGSLPSDIAGQPTGSPRSAAPASGTPTAAAPTAPVAGVPVATQPPNATQPPVVSEPTPVESFSAMEESLRDVIREDAAVNCAPRRSELPPGAIAGIECRPGTQPWPGEGWEGVPYGVAERVGVYQFENDEAATLAYLERMTEAGAVLDSDRDCSDPIGSDSAWSVGSADELSEGTLVEYQGARYASQRIGCFINDEGTANIRVTCGNGVYVGILGRDGDAGALVGWTWAPPFGPDTGYAWPPGICLGPIGFLP